MDKHFGRNHKYHEIFDSCMDNMTNIISSYNEKITNSYNEASGKT